MRINDVKIYAAMSRKEWNIKKLSETAGVSRATVSYIKNGKRCSDEVGQKIAAALEVDVTELIEN
jgi:DNA-binding Xre family transcriptional regulator